MFLELNEKIKTLIEKVLQQFCLENYPQELYEPIRYILSLQAKRLRPLLTILAYRLFKNDYESIISRAILVEIFHNFTLMHDDILDQSDLRRNQLTVNKKWNYNIALLAGDALLIKLYDFFYQKFDNESFIKIFPIFNRCALDICEGQQQDMNFEIRENITIEEYLLMIKLKTARLIGFSLQLGGLLAKVSPKTIEHLYNFGEYIGIAFQLQDDWLDIFGDQNRLGKPLGQDIINNKKTYMLIQALNKVDSSRAKILTTWLKAKTFDNTKKIEIIKNIYLDLSIDKITQQLINEYFNLGFDQLSKIDCFNTQAKIHLESTVKKMVNRQS